MLPVISSKLNLIVVMKNECKYFGITVDSKFSYRSHIKLVVARLSRQCGIISKLRHFVPRYQLLEYYKSVINPIMQYGILVYGCCTFSSLVVVHQLQKKILKFIFGNAAIIVMICSLVTKF